jgi:hypothetical protein
MCGECKKHSCRHCSSYKCSHCTWAKPPGAEKPYPSPGAEKPYTPPGAEKPHHPQDPPIDSGDGGEDEDGSESGSDYGYGSDSEGDGEDQTFMESYSLKAKPRENSGKARAVSFSHHEQPEQYPDYDHDGEIDDEASDAGLGDENEAPASFGLSDVYGDAYSAKTVEMQNKGADSYFIN